MRRKHLILLATVLSAGIFTQIGAQGAFYDSMNVYQPSVWAKGDWANGTPFNCGWLPDHISFSDGKMVIKLDNVSSHDKPYSSCECRTVSRLGFGTVEARLKAVKCSGVATTFFLYDDSTKDEIDLEFLGKNTQQLQTNYFNAGNGGHEHMIDLGFDASSDFHSYKIEWQSTSIKWYVDGAVKYSVTAAPLPSHQVQCMLSLWNGTGLDGWMGAFSYTAPLYAYYDYFSYTPFGVAVRAATNKSTEAGEPAMYLTDNALKISLVLGESGPVFVKLFNPAGKTIARFDCNSCNAGKNVFSLSMDGKLEAKNLSGGSFICSVSSKNATVSRKICYLK